MLAVALILRVCALALVRIVRFGTLRNRRTSAARACSGQLTGGANRDRMIGWAVETAAVVLPVGNSCLADALAAQWLLAACGRRSTIRFGVARDGAQALRAHAWVESGGEVKMSKQEIVALIEEAGFNAVERDTLYRPVEHETAAA